MSCGAEQSTYNPPSVGEPAPFRIGNELFAVANAAFAV